MSTVVYKAGQMLVGGSFVACALVSFGSEDLNESLPRREKAFPVRTNGGHEWRSASRKLSFLCCCCSDWILRISTSVRNNLVSCDWFRIGAEHTTRPYELHDSIASMCFIDSGHKNLSFFKKLSELASV